MDVLKILMEDAGCERFDLNCINNILELVSENKYPKLDDEEKATLDRSLAEQISKQRLKSQELVEKAEKAGLSKTADALRGMGVEEEEEGRSFVEETLESAPPPEPSERATARPPEAAFETPKSTVSEVKVIAKTSKVPIVLSLVSLVLSVAALGVLAGFIQGFPTNLRLKDVEILKNENKAIMAKLNELDHLFKSNIKALRQQLAEVIKEYKALSDSLNKLKDQTNIKIIALSIELNKTETDLMRTKGEIASLSSALIETQSTLNEIKSSLNTLNQTFTKRVVELEVKLRSFAPRINVLEKGLNKLYEEVKNLELRQASFATKDDLKVLISNITKLALELGRAEEELDAVKKELNDLKNIHNYLEELEKRISEIEKLEEEINELKEAYAGLNSTLREVVSNQTVIYMELVKINNSLRELKLDSLKTKEALNATVARLEALERRFDGFESNLTSIMVRILNRPEILNVLYNNLIKKYKIDKMVAEHLLSNYSVLVMLIRNVVAEELAKAVAPGGYVKLG